MEQARCDELESLCVAELEYVLKILNLQIDIFLTVNQYTFYQNMAALIRDALLLHKTNAQKVNWICFIIKTKQ